MKANEFVREHGLQYTRNLVRDYPLHTHTTDDGRMFINENTCEPFIKSQLVGLVRITDLKRLVESHELIEKDFESVEMAEYEYMVSDSYSDPYWVRVKQAIADVESLKEVS